MEQRQILLLSTVAWFSTTRMFFPFPSTHLTSTKVPVAILTFFGPLTISLWSQRVPFSFRLSFPWHVLWDLWGIYYFFKRWAEDQGWEWIVSSFYLSIQSPQWAWMLANSPDFLFTFYRSPNFSIFVPCSMPSSSSINYPLSSTPLISMNKGCSRHRTRSCLASSVKSSTYRWCLDLILTDT